MLTHLTALLLLAVVGPPWDALADPTTITLTDGAYSAASLVDGVWVDNEACVAGGFKDYYIDIDSSHAHDNLFLYVVVRPPLSPLLFGNRKPQDDTQDERTTLEYKMHTSYTKINPRRCPRTPTG